ncbi:MAG: DUF1573 domain-containing protein [Bacteroidales bacterium]|nr:DUF1573 domain-containing protein [Bacteroidales bacterium]
MYKYLIFGILLFSSFQLKAQENKAQAEIMFKDTLHIFGKIWYQGNAEYEFVFKNTGKTPLIISDVKSSCGCTVPEWSKKPVLPKEKGIIKVKYDTKRIGEFYKIITVYSNAKNSPVKLYVQGNVRVTD